MEAGSFKILIFFLEKISQKIRMDISIIVAEEVLKICPKISDNLYNIECIPGIIDTSISNDL